MTDEELGRKVRDLVKKGGVTSDYLAREIPTAQDWGFVPNLLRIFIYDLVELTDEMEKELEEGDE